MEMKKNIFTNRSALPGRPPTWFPPNLLDRSGMLSASGPPGAPPGGPPVGPATTRWRSNSEAQSVWPGLVTATVVTISVS